jgi:DUF1009 family protein
MKIGMIAGGGDFPLKFAEAAEKAGNQVYVVAYHGAADPKIDSRVHAVEWLYLGEMEKLIRFFHANGVKEAVIMGGVNKRAMFSDIRPDATALALIASLTETHDDALLRCFAAFLEQQDIAVRSSTFLLPELLAPDGCWTKNVPDRDQQRDIAIGWKVAKAIGRLDIDQCVVVEKGTVLAVEAIDGTDATITRGGRLGGGQAVVVKVCKPQQDTRFDIPAVGPDTIQTMRSAAVRVLAVETGRTVVFDREKMIAMADEAAMSIVAFREE